MNESNQFIYETNNYELLLGPLIGNVILLSLVLIGFKITLRRSTEKAFLPVLIGLIISLFPFFITTIFSVYDFLPWPNFGDEDTGIGNFRVIYHEWIGIFTQILLILSTFIFLQFIYKHISLKKDNKWLLFIPFVNHFFIGKFLLSKCKSNISRISIFLFLAFSIIFWFYKIIAPMLYIAGFNTYSWILSFMYDELNGETISGPFVRISEFQSHTIFLLMFISAICTIPIYIVTNRFKKLESSIENRNI